MEVGSGRSLDGLEQVGWDRGWGGKAGNMCWAQVKMVMYAEQSGFNFNLSFYKEVICSELGFIKLNLVALRKEGLREEGQFKKNYKDLD